jgi:hypothetical protein
MTLTRTLVVALVLLPCSAWAGRPLYTDDATLTEAQSCQLESWTQHSKISDQLSFYPACNPSGNFEVTAGYIEQRGLAGLQRSVSLQGKTLLRPIPTDGGYGAGVGFGVIKPIQGGSGESEYVYLPLSLSIYDNKLLTDVNVGWSHDQSTHPDKATWGVGESYVVNTHVTVFGEVFGDSSSNPTVHGGVSFAIIPDRIQLDLTCGKNTALKKDSNFFTAGINFYLPKLTKN